MQKRKYRLDAYEQGAVDSFKKNPTPELAKQIEDLEKRHLSGRQRITIRILQHDLNIIKIKAAKLGWPYQTYINMLIHKDAIKA